MIIFANIKTSDTYYNLGDEASSPVHNLDRLQAHPRVHVCITNLEQTLQEVGDNVDAIILGGGGLFMRDYHEKILDLTRRHQVIIWGAGLNYPINERPKDLMMALNSCALVGVRDKNFADLYGFEYVPCASCLHPYFHDWRGLVKPTHSVGVYRHHWSSPYCMTLPHITNMNRTLPFEQALNFLSNFETIITDSYHGAYWAMLLRRKVILWKPGGMRFFTGLPYIPPIAHTEDEVEQLLSEASMVREQLAVNAGEFRRLNLQFEKRILECL